MRAIEIFESLQINLANKAWHSLSTDAKDAIERWESMNWTGGALEQHIRANDAIAQEIHQAIQPAIQSIGKSHIRLYRGMTKNAEYDGSDKFLESWTSDKKYAEMFAGLRNGYGVSLVRKPITDEEIEKAYAQLLAKGFVRFRHHKYIKADIDTSDWQIKPKGPLYNIYTLGNSYVTDTDDPVESWKDDQQFINEQNQKRLDKAILLEEEISVDRIVWITNNLNSKEFIIRKNMNGH